MEQIPETQGVQPPEMPTPPAKPGFGRGLSAILRIFYAPGSVFAEIRDGLSVWPGLIGLVIVLVLVATFMTPIIMEFAQEQMEAQGASGVGEGALKGIMIGSQVFQGLLMLLVVAFFYWLALTVSFGGVGFGRVFALTIYTSFIGMLFQILNLVYIRFSGVEISSPQDLQAGMLNLSLGALFPEGGGFFVNVLNMLGVFQIWGLVLMIMGAAVITGKSRSQAAWPIMVIFLISVLVMAFLSGLSTAVVGASSQSGNRFRRSALVDRGRAAW